MESFLLNRRGKLAWELSMPINGLPEEMYSPHKWLPPSETPLSNIICLLTLPFCRFHPVGWVFKVQKMTAKNGGTDMLFVALLNSCISVYPLSLVNIFIGCLPISDFFLRNIPKSGEILHNFQRRLPVLGLLMSNLTPKLKRSTFWCKSDLLRAKHSWHFIRIILKNVRHVFSLLKI